MDDFSSSQKLAITTAELIGITPLQHPKNTVLFSEIGHNESDQAFTLQTVIIAGVVALKTS